METIYDQVVWNSCHSVLCASCKAKLDRKIQAKYFYVFDGKDVVFATLTVGRLKQIGIAFDIAYKALYRFRNLRLSKSKFDKIWKKLDEYVGLYLNNKERYCKEKGRPFDRNEELERLCLYLKNFESDVMRFLEERGKDSVHIGEYLHCVIRREETLNREGIHIHFHMVMLEHFPFFLLEYFWRQCLAKEYEKYGLDFNHETVIVDIRKIPTKMVRRYLEEYLSKNEVLDFEGEGGSLFNLNSMATSLPNIFRKGVSLRYHDLLQLEEMIRIINSYVKYAKRRKRWFVWNIEPLDDVENVGFGVVEDIIYGRWVNIARMTVDVEDYLKGRSIVDRCKFYEVTDEGERPVKKDEFIKRGGDEDYEWTEYDEVLVEYGGMVRRVVYIRDWGIFVAEDVERRKRISREELDAWWNETSKQFFESVVKEGYRVFVSPGKYKQLRSEFYEWCKENNMGDLVYEDYFKIDKGGVL